MIPAFVALLLTGHHSAPVIIGLALSVSASFHGLILYAGDDLPEQQSPKEDE